MAIEQATLNSDRSEGREYLRKQADDARRRVRDQRERPRLAKAREMMERWEREICD